ncbi:MAG: hypothetical protein HY680_11030 [Chloroflexi bacterium]|nr:hypothetical protein [Chloroflexota bacterium]
MRLASEQRRAAAWQAVLEQRRLQRATEYEREQERIALWVRDWKARGSPGRR